MENVEEFKEIKIKSTKLNSFYLGNKNFEFKTIFF